MNEGETNEGSKNEERNESPRRLLKITYHILTINKVADGMDTVTGDGVQPYYIVYRRQLKFD